MALAAGTAVRHYRIIEKIGVGGMGEVYLAEDLVNYDGQAHILDFGLAAIKEADMLTKTGSTMGTLHLSPTAGGGYPAVFKRSQNGHKAEK